jgi:ABC-type glycerol-3-phosphate transport system permease component
MARTIRASVVFALLAIGTLFVLFPFFWMVATALKEEGKGMSFEFIPSTVVEAGPFTLKERTIPEGLAREDVTTVAEDSSVVIAWKAPEASSVTLKLEGPGDHSGSRELTRRDDGAWALAEALPPGDYTYSVTVLRTTKAAWQSLYTLSNFRKIAKNPNYPFATYLLNSFIVALTCAILTVAICALAAYVFAKKEFPGKNVLFWIFMAAMMIPGMMYMVPQFALVTRFGWINSIWGLVVPHLSNVFGLFMLKQMMQGIPDSLFEAARIDGASEWTVFRKIVIPLSFPSLFILFLLTFVGQWNNFLWQLLVNTPESPLITLPVGLAMFRGQYETQWEQMMAASSFSILPIVALFLITQRYLIEGLTAGGVKE